MSYQLQLPVGMLIEDLAERTARRAWEALAGPADLGAGHSAFLDAMRREALAVLKGRIYSFDTCGLHGSCFDAAMPAEWNTTGHAVPRARRSEVRLAHLRLPLGLRDFGNELAAALVKAAGLDPAVDKDVARAATAVHAVIGPYLFTSDVCEIDMILRTAEPARPFAN